MIGLPWGDDRFIGVRRAGINREASMLMRWEALGSPAAEAAVGLAIILTVFKNRETLNIDEVNTLKN